MPTIGEMVELAPLVTGEKVPLTHLKGNEGILIDPGILLKYLTGIKAALSLVDELPLKHFTQEKHKIIKALIGAPAEMAKRTEGITDDEVKIHRAFMISLLDLDDEPGFLKGYLGKLYTEDFNNVVKKHYEEAFDTVLSALLAREEPIEEEKIKPFLNISWEVVLNAKDLNLFSIITLLACLKSIESFEEIKKKCDRTFWLAEEKENVKLLIMLERIYYDLSEGKEKYKSLAVLATAKGLAQKKNDEKMLRKIASQYFDYEDEKMGLSVLKYVHDIATRGKNRNLLIKLGKEYLVRGKYDLLLEVMLEVLEGVELDPTTESIIGEKFKYINTESLDSALKHLEDVLEGEEVKDKIIEETQIKRVCDLLEKKRVNRVNSHSLS